MTEREKIAARIRALLAKTVANGCTEEEALSAARLAASLLAKYNMTVDETELRANPFKRETASEPDAVGERLWKVAKAISELVGTTYWRSRAGVNPVQITFFGFEHEVEISHYLLAICTRAMKDGERKAQWSNQLFTLSKRRMATLAYLDGMADRLAERIIALKPAEQVGTGLVALRDQLIEQALQDEGIKLNGKKERASRDFALDYLIGRADGEKVGLNQGLTGRRDEPKRLG